MLLNRTIADICRIFGINEKWLRTGEGRMFTPSPVGALEALAREYELSPGMYILIKRLLALKPENQQAAVDFAIKLAEDLNRLDESAADAKNTAPTPAPDTPGQERTVADAGGQEYMEAEKKSRIAAERKAGQEEMDAAEELTPEEQENLDSYRREMIAKRGQTGQPSALPNANVS